MTDDLKYWVAFNLIPGIGRVRFGLLEGRFGSMEEAWKASGGALRAAGLDSRSLGAIETARPGISPDAEMERLQKARVHAIAIHDPAYPALLKETFDPPPLLYVKGALTAEDDWAVTVVGTRAPTAYGREVTQRLAGDLGRSRITVVSGLARGIDSVAHSAALDSGGRTIAVQACGLDMVYPAAHLPLARRILECGALISDYPLGTKPRSEYFPRRNRILAGLTAGTLVVEAGERSGALITARFAADEGREVMCVPGSILSPASRGVNRWIQEGAKAVLDVTDILEELNLRVTAQPAQQIEQPGMTPVDDTESAILRHITSEPTHVDVIRHTVGLSIAEVSSALTTLELKGLMRQAGPMNYVLERNAGVDYATSTP